MFSLKNDSISDPVSTLLKDKVLGCIYGLVTGDALGCPVEGRKPRDIIRDYGQVTEMLENKKRWRPKGLHSDDAQQAMALCDALLENSDNPVPSLARFFVDLYRDGPKMRGAYGGHRGTGKNFRVMTRLLANQCPLSEAAQVSAGNGVAMMIAPAALYFRDDEEALARCILQVGLMKQKDPRGIAAAGAVAYLCKEGLASLSFSELSRRGLLQFVQGIEHRASAALESTEHRHTFSKALQAMLGELHKEPEQVYGGIEARANKTSNRRVGPASGYALASVISSIYVALTASGVEQGLIDIVNLGGDADTTAAMTGAMLGALCGYSSIPQRWLNDLVAKDAFHDRLGPLIAQSNSFRPHISLLSQEIAWTGLMART